MSTNLRQQLDRLETQRIALFSRVDDLDDDTLNRSPAEGQWSIIQVLSHLATAEKLSLVGIRKKLADRSGLHKAGIVEGLKSLVLTVALRLPLRIKAPARSSTVPERQDLEATRREWDEVRADWRETIDSFPPELVDQTIFKHPVVGPLNIAQALRFMYNHVDRHSKQIDRILHAG